MRRSWWSVMGLISCLLVMSAPGLPPTARADEFTRHVVVAQEVNAAEIGRDALRRGGGAVDAAVATAFALAVTHPAAGNIGGGGFLVAYDAREREVVTFDFREMAPKRSTPRMYLGPDGKLKPRHRAGALAAGVPGTVRGLALAHRKLGRLAWPDLVRPAARLARQGFPISATLARSLNAQLFDPSKLDVARDDLGRSPDRLADFAGSVAAFRKADGSPWRAEDRLIQGDLADTLERIAAEGPDEFYTGRTADLIAAYMAAQGGLISRDDLADYQARERPPVHTTYRGCDVYGVGPPSSGGIVLALMLNILERYDLRGDGPGSPLTLHRVTEAMRRGYFTRATAIGDPDFVAVPAADLTSKAHADELARSIGDRATPSAALAPFPILDAEGNDTTHLSTLDADGNAVALTYTLEEGYGSKAVVAGAGFLLNNEMGDFNLIPGRTDTGGRIGTPANQIAGGKRMLSSQTPTLVLRDGRVRLVTGSPGGRTIPNTTLWVVLNVLEFGLDPRAAVDAPRTHHPWFPDVLTLEGQTTPWPESTRSALGGLGHSTRIGGIQGDAHSIVVDPASGIIHGVADRRRTTSRAAGD
jgi:gamma-glutamyltranspeptidase/glutathione hydrolase